MKGIKQITLTRWLYLSLRKSGQELKHSSRFLEAGRIHGGWSFWASLDCFRIGARTTSSRAPLSLGLALPHWWLIEKMPNSCVSWRSFLHWVSFLSDDTTLCLVCTPFLPGQCSFSFRVFIESVHPRSLGSAWFGASLWPSTVVSQDSTEEEFSFSLHSIFTYVKEFFIKSFQLFYD